MLTQEVGPTRERDCSEAGCHTYLRPSPKGKASLPVSEDGWIFCVVSIIDKRDWQREQKVPNKMEA